ncbi:MAG: ribosome biogenesis GTPase Der [Gammaproteobacteria bacterium]|nr:ribosome biogenesis GTPase Der [Gammaproteobacteria bacterium]MDH5727734.1 ribosome biogenesis GTPase Der [Gammaproteobacteria bacterium]
MKKTIALVGRPNVGKSTLYNRLTRTRDALVADEPGLTRDRRYGRATYQDQEYIVVDTGGLSSKEEGLDSYIGDQAMMAVEEADVVFFLVDGRAGMVPDDEIIARQLRNKAREIYLLVNKTERTEKGVLTAEFFALGLGDPYAVSSAHGEGLDELLSHIDLSDDSADEEAQTDDGAKVAIIGRPNVGKSTLVNRLLGEERVLAFDMPGTTRDSIFIPFEHDGEAYTLIDTAGVRRRSKVSDKIEKFSVIKTLQAIEAANAVILVLDAHQGISNQDATLLGYIEDAGKPLLIAINKWDGLPKEEKEFIKKELDRKLTFIDYASVHFISALHGTGVGLLMQTVSKAYQASRKQFQTNLLTRILEDAIASHQPPMVRGRRIKLRYAHQGGQNPPIIVIHGTQAESVPDSYRRYLSNIYRKVLKLEGTPVRVEFRGTDNPYKDRRNTLTPRQMQKKKRLMKHVKKNDKRKKK